MASDIFRRGCARALASAVIMLLSLAAPWPESFAQDAVYGRSDALFRPWALSRGQSERPRTRDRSEAREVRPTLSPDTELVSRGRLPLHLQRRSLDYATTEAPGTIIVDTANTHLYLVLGMGKAIRYGIGVGREGFRWTGRERISRMAEWPEWRPPKEMIDREPDLPRFMPGGPRNPLGARALYLGDTLYRIHGTNEPSTIGQYVSSGCIRLRNEDIIDLYRRVKIGAQVVVLSGELPELSSIR